MNRLRLARPCRLAARLALAVLLVGCSPDDPPPARHGQSAADGIALTQPGRQFITIEAAGGPSAAWRSPLPARVAVRPQAMAAVGAPVSGRVMTVGVRPGELVKAGATVITLQSPDAAAARAALEQAAARSAAAEDRLRRQDELSARGVGLEVERFEAQIALREAAAELGRARRAVALFGAGSGDEVRVRAPASGVVSVVRASVGAMVQPDGEALVEIADPSRLWMVAEVAEPDLAGISTGQRASIRVPGLDAELEGRVDGMGSAVDPETRRVPVYVVLKAPPVRGLTPGMLAEIRLSVDEATPLSVPVAAVLIKDGSRRIVYVERADGQLEPREVRTGTSTAGGRVAILEGLRSGERVVVRGALLLDAEADQLL